MGECKPVSLVSCYHPNRCLSLYLPLALRGTWAGLSVTHLFQPNHLSDDSVIFSFVMNTLVIEQLYYCCFFLSNNGELCSHLIRVYSIIVVFFFYNLNPTRQQTSFESSIDIIYNQIYTAFVIFCSI